MTEIATLKSGIETRVAGVLGVTYSELAHILEVEKNSFKRNAKRYGVLGLSISQNEGAGVMGKYTVDQVWTIKQTDSFANKQITDTNQISAIDVLMQNTLDIYKDLCNSQAGSPALVTQLNNLSVEDPEVIDDNIVVVTMSFLITYRKLLGA